MLKRWSAIVCAVGLLVVTSCQTRGGHPQSAFDRQAVSYLSSPSPEQSAAAPEPQGRQFAAEGRRYIAVRHKLQIETREADLQKSWESANSYCLAIKCEVVSSSFSNRTRSSPAWGNLSVRVAPEDLSKFLSQLDKSGTLVQHSTENEDKTAAVIDVEAKIKNLTGFRDGLRVMLAKPPPSIKDLLEVQRELATVQAQLDSESTRRKVLADETDKVSVDLSFRAEWSGSGAGTFGPIAKAWRESMNVLAESIGVLISATFALAPWIVTLCLILWPIRKFWWKRKARVLIKPATPPL